MKKSPTAAIRKKCLECSCNSKDDVLNCPVRDCPLWEYRLGNAQDAIIPIQNTEAEPTDVSIPEEQDNKPKVIPTETRKLW